MTEEEYLNIPNGTCLLLTLKGIKWDIECDEDKYILVNKNNNRLEDTTYSRNYWLFSERNEPDYEYEVSLIDL